MCGVIGIFARSPVNQALYDGLTVLQHRGQDAAGIVTCEDNRLFMRKSNGLVRYPTAGNFSSAEAQPFYVNSPFGITLAHNGNLTNAAALKRDLFVEDRRHINTDSDSEILLNVFAHELQSCGKLKIEPGDIFEAVAGVHRRCRGAYAVVAMITGYGILAFRDPHGIRPLAIGRRQTPEGPEYIVASESVAIDVLGYELLRDVQAGEAVFIDMAGAMHARQCAESPELTPCIFEHVYFARPDSLMDGISVYKARLRMGKYLARKIEREFPDHDIDVVLPIPDTSRTAALQLSYTLGVKYSEGFIKNRYIGRTFIMPGQTQRKKSVRQKLNPIDMPAAHELIGHGRTEEEICAAIGADRLFFQDLDDLVKAVSKKVDIQRFDTSVFNGEYVTGDVTPEYLAELEARRNDQARADKLDKDNEVLEIHNTA